MKRALLLLPLLLLAGCSSEEPRYPAETALANRYVTLQAEGRWQELCPLLDQRELGRIQKSTGSSCERISGDLARRLQESARGARVLSVEAEGNLFRVDLGRGEFWIGPEGILLRRD